MGLPVTPADLSAYLGSTVDEARAQTLIDMVTVQARTVVPELPEGADSVIVPAAARLYSNPESLTTKSVGSVSWTRSTPSGSMLSRREKTMLRRLAGQRGAFTIDPTPADAMADYIDPLESPTVAEAEEWVTDYPDIGAP